MDKNFFLAIFLSVLVYVGWFGFIQKRYGGAPQPPAAGSAARPGAPGDARPGERPATRLERPEIGPTTAPDPTPETGGIAGALAYRIGSGPEGLLDLHLKIQPMGAGIVSYRYPGPLGPVELVEEASPGYFATWPELRFTPVGDANWPAFEAAHPSGVTIRKEYLFRDLGSLHTLRLRFTNPGSSDVPLPEWTLALGPGIGTVASEEQENATMWHAAALLDPKEGRKTARFEEFDLDEPASGVKEPWRWLAVHNRYFLASVFPPREQFDSFSYGATKKETLTSGWFGQRKKALVSVPWLTASAQRLSVPAQGSLTVEVPFYFGPKGFTHLRRLERGLERSVSFGWFQTLGRLTIRFLGFLHNWTGNWGWAIILMTICLQVVLFPLTYKSMKSMTLMKKIQPEQAKLQQKFKNDPQRMQRELMELYRKRGVNPLGGCLPMIAQMPIFIALFNTLRNAWELHGASWIFWVKDLSAPDPFYALPILMGAVMFFQSKLNPAPGDPAQAKMMQYMPIIFTFMFLNFPAGLVLYWLMNSLLGFGQQIVIKRRMEA